MLDKVIQRLTEEDLKLTAIEAAALCVIDISHICSLIYSHTTRKYTNEFLVWKMKEVLKHYAIIAVAEQADSALDDKEFIDNWNAAQEMQEEGQALYNGAVEFILTQTDVYGMVKWTLSLVGLVTGVKLEDFFN